MKPSLNRNDFLKAELDILYYFCDEVFSAVEDGRWNDVMKMACEYRGFSDPNHDPTLDTQGR